MTQIPESFARRMHELYGARGDVWIEQLPALLQHCTERFRLELGSVFTNLSWNFLTTATKLDADLPVVLKLAIRPEELRNEWLALDAYAGRGAVKVIDVDFELGALVLEQAQPGTPLAAVDDDSAATTVFCEVCRHLHEQPISTTQLPTLQQHFGAFARLRDRIDTQPQLSRWLALAEVALANLWATTKRTVLLHGDLHHDNILRQGHGWTTIDPKGILGDPHFEPIQFLLNHVERGGTADEVLSRRIAIMADRLGLDPSRIARWGMVRGVLEACWIVEDGNDNWQDGIDITLRFAHYLGVDPEASW
ncbi:MAG: phosphotransferase [Alicyclobacillus sp.]|nr:phosphotransferase [Alicyclobacillus sp.]